MDIQKKVLRLISEQCGLSVKEIESNQLTTKKEFGFDSIDEVEFIMALEDEFDLMIPDAEAERLKDIQDVVSYVTSEL